MPRAVRRPRPGREPPSGSRGRHVRSSQDGAPPLPGPRTPVPQPPRGQPRRRSPARQQRTVYRTGPCPLSGLTSETVPTVAPSPATAPVVRRPHLPNPGPVRTR